MDRGRTPEDPALEDQPDTGATALRSGTPAQRRYPAVAPGTVLAKAAERAPAGAPPTIDDVATAAVESKGAGSPVPSAVRGPVEAQLGVDLAGARVHDDPGSRQAAGAMGARAFAHGGDVFLGPGESGGDLGLMAHELTHVAQQGAAQDKAVQRQVAVGAADSPAEKQADAVAGQVTAGAAPTQLIIDSGELQTGQWLKSAFMTVLRMQVSAAVSAELGPLWDVAGCPYIDAVFARYQNADAAAVERTARRYSRLPAPKTASELIPPIVARVRDGVHRWKDGDDISGDLQAAGYTGPVPPPPTLKGVGTYLANKVEDKLDAAGQAVTELFTGPLVNIVPHQVAMGAALKPVDPAAPATAQSLVTELGPPQPLDGATASRMGEAFGGEDFSQVKVHTGEQAQRKVADAGGSALAVGQHVAFAAGEYQPGTPRGDAMLAHELAHTVQQRGAGAG
ncbi:MAG TPA: DUF4157 domain-containing protein, partial [Kofleriaceae bacterium]|nr:DUF4157 domain-containing protein [Kofleriaceae bacterium]